MPNHRIACMYMSSMSSALNAVSLLEIKCLKQIYSACAFTVPPGTPHMVLLAHLEKCVHHTTYWCFLHTHAVVLAHQIWCASTVAPSTPMQFGVYNTPQVLCPEWQIVKCSTHPLWCVLYTRCRSVLQTLH